MESVEPFVADHPAAERKLRLCTHIRNGQNFFLHRSSPPVRDFGHDWANNQECPRGLIRNEIPPSARLRVLVSVFGDGISTDQTHERANYGCRAR
jgi:hypothetical protein